MCGMFFNEKLKNMHSVPRGMEKMRQDFRLEGTTPPTAIVESPTMTPSQIRMAKVRAARKVNVATANS